MRSRTAGLRPAGTRTRFDPRDGYGVVYMNAGRKFVTVVAGLISTLATQTVSPDGIGPRTVVDASPHGSRGPKNGAPTLASVRISCMLMSRPYSHPFGNEPGTSVIRFA